MQEAGKPAQNGELLGESSLALVGIGASAGGLPSIEILLESLPADVPAALLLVQHLSPEYPSQLKEILQRRTQLEVRDAKDGERLQPGTVYIMPPGQSMVVEGQILRVRPAEGEERLRPIDRLFASIAQAADTDLRAGVVLSGTGSDGTRGSLSLREQGGLMIAEDPETAGFAGMPSSVIEAKGADLVLGADGIARPLASYVSGGSIESVVEAALAEAERSVGSVEPLPDEVLSLLFSRSGHDFRLHRDETLRRRYHRTVANSGLGDSGYVDTLRDDPVALDDLFRDLLIGVTDFFRDPEAFEALAQVLCEHLQESCEKDSFRVWVTGCSTGEEAYSVAILALEAMERTGCQRRLEVFATDLIADRVESASQGLYARDSLSGLDPTRLERWFEKRPDGSHQVRSELRDRIFFSIHDLTRDVPFSGLDLVVCRNLIIYLQPEAQRSVLMSLLYGLEQDGLLFLGMSESLGSLADQCQPVDETHRIFRKTGEVAIPELLPMLFPEERSDLESAGAAKRAPRPSTSAQKEKTSLLRVYDRLLDLNMPPSFLLSEELNVLECFSGAERFLRVPARRMKSTFTDLLNCNDPVAVSTALAQLGDSIDARISVPIRVENSDGESAQVHLRAARLVLDDSSEEYVLVSIVELLRRVSDEDVPAREQSDPSDDRVPRLTAGQGAQIRVLEGELLRTRRSLKDAIEDLASTNEELQSSNQELAASNEELQSSNEELRSVNDELQRLNDEYQKIIGELRDANRDLEYMFEASEVGLVFIDSERRVRRFTPSAQSYLRIRTADLGRSFYELATRLPDLDLREMVDEVLADGTSMERESTSEDGERILVGARLISDRQEEGVALTFTDLSGVDPHRRHIRRMKAVLASTGDAIWSIGRNGTVMTWNPAAEQMMGYQRDEVLDQNALFLFPSDRVGELRKKIERVQDRRVIDRSETLLLRKGGEVVDAEITLSAVEDEQSEVVGVSFVARDLRPLRRFIRELERSEERFQDLFEHAPDAYLVIEPGTARVLNCNQRLLELLGYEREETVGLSLFQLLSSKTVMDSQADLDVFLQEFALGTATPLWVRRADGAEIAISMTFVEILDDDGEVSQIRLTWRDISQRLEIEQDLLLEIERRDRYLAILSHELRNPLNAMRTANQVLARSEAEYEQKAYALTVIDQQTAHMARLLEDLLDTARVLQQKLEVRPEVVRAMTVLDAALNSVRGAAEDKGIRIETTCDDGELFCKADPDRLQQAMANLLNNSVKYCRESDGLIEVTLEAIDDDAGEWVVFEVKDNGIGIDESLLPRIFDLFTQADDSLDRSAGGMGLGLALVRSIADLHGGFVDASSEGVGRGSTFRLGLPRTLAQVEGTSPISRAETRRVMIVEDQEDSRVGLATLLELEGHEVVIAEEGRAAIEMFREAQPEVVLLDIGLPGIDGYEVARRLRKIDTRGVMMVALTGYGTAEDVERALEAGFDHHMIKPLDPDKLLNLLSSS